MDNKQQFVVFKPDAKIFSHTVPADATPHIVGTPTVYACDHIEYPEKGGVLVYYKGLKYPVKGFPYPDAIRAINVVKKGLTYALAACAQRSLAPFFILGFLLPGRKQRIEDLIEQFNHYAKFSLEYHFVQPHYMTECSQAVYSFVCRFSTLAGLTSPVMKRFALIIANLIEYDNAYRFRVQDMLSETSKELLIFNPIRELKRIIAIYSIREFRLIDLTRKFNRINRFISLLLYIPRFRKAFKQAIQESTFEYFQYDEFDWASVLTRGDYLFGGKTFQERSQEFLKLQDGVLPPQYQLQ